MRLSSLLCWATKKTIDSKQTRAYWVNVERIQWVAGLRAWAWDHHIYINSVAFTTWLHCLHLTNTSTTSTRPFNNLLYNLHFIDTVVVKYVVGESFNRAEQVFSTKCVRLVPNSFGQTNIRSIVLYLNNWKQTVSSIMSIIPVCYKLVFLSVVPRFRT